MPWRQQPGDTQAEISHAFEPRSRHVANVLTLIIYINMKQYNNKIQKLTTYTPSPLNQTQGCPGPWQQLKNDLLLQGHWGREDACGSVQFILFNSYMPRYFVNTRYPEAKSLPILANGGLLQNTTEENTQPSLP